MLRAAISSAITLRQRRAAILPAELQGEPAWDILLDLAERHLTGGRRQTSGVGNYNSPLTTRLRWIRLLEARGWIEREPDRNDNRRTWLKITDEGMNAVAACFGLGRPDALITTTQALRAGKSPGAR